MAKTKTVTTTKQATKAINTKTKTEKPKAEPKAKRAPTLYNTFVKDNMAKWREENPGKSHREAMAGIGAMWKDAPENPNRGQEPKSKKASTKKTDKEPIPSSSDTES